MEPILSPWIVYLGQVFEGLNTVAVCLLLFGVLILIITGSGLVCSLSDGFYDPKDEGYKVVQKIFKISAVVTIVGILSLLFIPNRETYYGMVASSYVTPDNVTTVTNYGKDIVDYIFEKMQGEEDD